MGRQPYLLEHVDKMIDFFEQKIDTNAVTPVLVEALQKRLDDIEAANRDNSKFAEYYARMLELQALLYGEGGQEARALEFLREAIRQAGGVGKLRSRLLRQYIVIHTLPSLHQPAQPVASKSSEPTILPDLQPVPVPVATGQPEQPMEPAEQNMLSQGSQLKRTFRLFRRMKAVAAVTFGLVTVSVLMFTFVPQASGLANILTNHLRISDAKHIYIQLTDEYHKCSAQLSSERGSVDTYDTQAVNAYNQAAKHCEWILSQQQTAANRYNSLIGPQF